MKHGTMNKKGALDIITTAILLVTFIIVVIFLTISIAVITIRGDASGKVLLKVSVGSIYDEERNILYYTDEYGNKVTDMMGQALLISGASVTIKGTPHIDVPANVLDNTAYDCPPAGTHLENPPNGRYDAVYKTTTISLNAYMRCYVMPKKLEKTFGAGGYCMSLAYDEGGSAEKKTVYGNETMGCAGEQKITADLSPPPGFDRPIYMRIKRA